MNCPRCQSSDHRKDGTLKGIQRYLCKQCLYRYSEEKKDIDNLSETKKIAERMFLNGLNIKLIGKVLKLKKELLIEWETEWEEINCMQKSNMPKIEVLEFEELKPYIREKIKNPEKNGLVITEINNGITKIFIEK